MLGLNLLNIVGTNSFLGNNSDIGLYGSYNTKTFIALEFEQAGDGTAVAQVFSWANGKFNTIGYVGNDGKYGLFVLPNAEGAVSFTLFDIKNLGSNQLTTKLSVGDKSQYVVNDSDKGFILNTNALLATEFHLYPIVT